MLNLRAKYQKSKGKEWEVLLIEIHTHILREPTVIAVSSKGELFEDDIHKFYEVKWPE